MKTKAFWPTSFETNPRTPKKKLMKRTPLKLRPHLFLLLQADTGVPYSARLNLRKASGYLLLCGVMFFFSATGSLLFFRELELNRKLSERVLELETREDLSHLGQPGRIESEQRREVVASRTTEANAPLVAAAPERTTSAVTTSEGVPPTAVAPTTTAASAGSAVGARIADLVADCVDEDCDVKLNLVPTKTGVAQGDLLLVLEAEIPRIGAGNPTNQVRKRFFIYPSGQSRDDFSPNQLAGLQKKPFRFTRALRTGASFSVGKLLRPIAINAYLFDKEKALIQHERKTIDREE